MSTECYKKLLTVTECSLQKCGTVWSQMHSQASSLLPWPVKQLPPLKCKEGSIANVSCLQDISYFFLFFPGRVKGEICSQHLNSLQVTLSINFSWGRITSLLHQRPLATLHFHVSTRRKDKENNAAPANLLKCISDSEHWRVCFVTPCSIKSQIN